VIKCFRCQELKYCALECPNKRIMILTNDAVNDEFECDNMPALGDVSDIEYIVNGESFIIKRSLNFRLVKKMLINKGRISFIMDVT